MARFIVACILVAGLCTAGMVVLGQTLWDPKGPNPPVVKDKDKKEDTGPGAPPVVGVPKPADRPSTVSSAEDEKGPIVIREMPALRASPPMTILDARVMAVQQQSVPAERDGKFMFLATEIEPGEYVPDDKKLSFEISTLAIRVKDEREWAALPARDQLIALTNEGKPGWFRPVTDTDNLLDSETALVTRKVTFRTIDVGERVRPGQMLGLINPVLALAEVRKQQQKVEAAHADVRAAAFMKEESVRRYQRDLGLSRTGGKGAISIDELNISKVTADKYREEEAAKAAAVKMAQAELAATFTALRQHIVRSSIAGVIRQTFKHPGEAVKMLDPVVQIQNPGIVRVDGQVEVQDALVLRGRLNEAERYRAEAARLWREALAKNAAAPEPENARAYRQRADRLTAVEVEASRQEPPQAVLSGHRNEVNCVAVTREASPRIISASDDRTVRIWTRVPGEDRWVEQKEMTHAAGVRTVAVTGPKAGRNLLLTGTVTGRGRIFDLDDLKADAVNLSSRHTGSITAAAFSADGKMVVTGGDDSALCLWNVEDGKLLGRVPNAHRAAVTSVAFTAKDQVVSAGRDKRMNVWNLAEGGEAGRTLKFDHYHDRRGGEVAAVGVGPTGEHTIIDDEKELSIRTISGKRTLGTLRNPAGTTGFGHFALFSPDGKTILTGGNAAGRVQLWRAPGESARTGEMRHYLWSGLATCAAFDPAGKFAVTGTQDNRILVWKMPDKMEVETPLPGQLTFVEEFLDINARKLSIRADVKNPGWVIPGASATIVVPPAGKGS